jgi:hypothetical protein
MPLRVYDNRWMTGVVHPAAKMQVWITHPVSRSIIRTGYALPGQFEKYVPR